MVFSNKISVKLICFSWMIVVGASNQLKTMQQSQRNLQDFRSTGCIDGVVFTAVTALPRTFEGAVIACQEINPAQNSVLASLTTINQFQTLVDLMNQIFPVLDDFSAFYIGLSVSDEQENGTNTVPRKFSYIADLPGISEITGLGNSEFPWGTSQPDDFQQNQNCAAIFRSRADGGELRLDDDSCFNEYSFICSSECIATTADASSKSNVGTLFAVLVPILLIASMFSIIMVKDESFRESIYERFGVSSNVNEKKLQEIKSNLRLIDYPRGSSVDNLEAELDESSPESAEKNEIDAQNEAEFEAIIANKGKMPDQGVSPEDEAEFEAILAGKKKKPNKYVLSSQEARPQSAYLKSTEASANRRSIFRPSSLFLSKAKRDRAMKAKILENETKPPSRDKDL